jgi:hypothetical protein
MNDTETIFLYVIYISSILIHVLALYITTAYVIPLQIKEAKVQNGLKKLRIQMLASGATLMALSVVSIIILTIPLIVTNIMTRYITVFLVLIHSSGFLVFALIKSAMYHSQYSEQSKSDHQAIAKLENNRT